MNEQPTKTETRICLDQLHIEHFQSIKMLDWNPGGQDWTITAKNGVGKTTVANAGGWLIHGKGTLGETLGDSVKPTDESNEPIHNLTTVVRAVLTVNGEPLTLKKTHAEVWTTPNGQSEMVLTKHETLCWFNDEPVLIGVYEKRLSDICLLPIWQLLMNPWLFNGKYSTEDKRKALLELAGEVSTADVIALAYQRHLSDDKCPDIRGLAHLLSSRSIDALKKIMSETLTLAKKERISIPAQISENSRLKAEVPKGDHAGNIVSRTERLRNLNTKLAGAKSSGGVAELTTEVQKITGEMLVIQNRYTAKGNPEREKAQTKSRELTSQIADASLKISTAETKILADESKLSQYQRMRQPVLANIATVKERITKLAEEVFPGAGKCTMCGQDLPEAEVDKLRETFNSGLARRKEQAQTDLANERKESMRLKELIQTLAGYTDANSNETFAGSISVAKHDVETAKAALEGLKLEKAALVIPEDVAADHTQDAEWLKLSAKKTDTEAKIANAGAGNSAVILGIGAEIETAEALLAESKAHVASIEQNAKIEDRIAELEESLTRIKKQIEEAEILLYQCEWFERTWCDMLNERISSHFEVTRWKLFRKQMNGGIEQVCQAIYAGSGNRPSDGQAIEVGMDITRTFQRHHGVSVPVFVDRYESYTGSFPMNCQVIKLKAVEGLAKLTFTPEGAPDPFAEDESEVVDTEIKITPDATVLPASGPVPLEREPTETAKAMFNAIFPNAKTEMQKVEEWAEGNNRVEPAVDNPKPIERPKSRRREPAAQTTVASPAMDFGDDPADV
jgi:hypothetical protein